jgi:hypothetical protein
LRVSAICRVDKTETARLPKTKNRVIHTAKAQVLSHLSKRPQSGGRMSGPGLELVVRSNSSHVPMLSSTAAVGPVPNEISRSGFETISTGSNARLALLTTLSASKSRAGDPFEAVLVQPMRLDTGQLLPEGTVFEGHVTGRVPPRRLSRAGSLYVAFTRVDLPGKAALPIAASVAGVGVGQRSRVKVNSEGGMSGGSPGKARLLLELGVGAGISKVVDDTYQLIVEALVSTATDASTAGTARLIAFAFTGAYWLTRRGPDITLPRYTPITIRFDRPPSLPLPRPTPQHESAR